MQKLSFNEDWYCDGVPVSLPHDAMLGEERSPESAGGTNTGWFMAGDHEYCKTFEAPAHSSYIEFEGIYHKAEIFLDGKKMEAHPNGYFGFRVPVTPGYHEIRVIAHNADQPNSRWYTGTGIYRPVWIYTLPEEHIEPESIWIQTSDWKNRVVNIGFQTSDNEADRGHVKVQILDGEVVLNEKSTASSKVEFCLTDAELWNPENPKLYQCRLTYGEDIQTVPFGIRQISCDARKGFCINGERILLLGACMHHDNGILGAVGHPFAERRKVELLKRAGFNAIRSAHNPVSKAILNACDELGMLVLDEYTDMWYMHKTEYDYAEYVEKNWQKDLKLLTLKDRNHPSVVMYSIGNEVGESARRRGIDLAEKMVSYLHELDDRPVTCGINIFFNYLSAVGLGVYSDKKAEKDAARAEKNKRKNKKRAVGSEFFNNLAGLLGADFMKFGATLHGSDIKTRQVFSKLDVAGYNYGVKRYSKDLKRYPERVILGSETFATDAVDFYDLAVDHPALIGDFVWAGIDYLGETGIGAWEYEDYAPDFEHNQNWLTAGAGMLDLIGKETCQMAYMQVAYEKTPIRIGVIPVKYALLSHSPAAWRMTNAIESWSWNGCEGMQTTVEVYARGKEVELILNGRTLERKSLSKKQMVRFGVTYQPGNLTAVVYDDNGDETARTCLMTAGEETYLHMRTEQKSVKQGDLLYVHLQYTDRDGIVKPLERGEITIRVEGGTLLALGNACSYNERGYLTDTTDTYYGEAMAIIRPEYEVTIQADSVYGREVITVPYEG